VLQGTQGAARAQDNIKRGPLCTTAPQGEFQSRGPSLQADRSRLTMAPGSTEPLTKRARGMLLGVKGGRPAGLSLPSVSRLSGPVVFDPFLPCEVFWRGPG
jgi:hypothetical protein